MYSIITVSIIIIYILLLYAIYEAGLRYRRDRFEVTNSGGETDQSMWLNEHNRIRADVGQRPVTWNADIAKGAIEFAKRCRAEQGSCIIDAETKEWPTYFRHSKRSERLLGKIELGENIAFGCPADKFDSNLAMVIWENEKKDYKYPQGAGQNTSGKQIGHYRQIIDQKVKEIGCGCSTCGDNSKLCVCRYNPIQHGFEPPY